MFVVIVKIMDKINSYYQGFNDAGKYSIKYIFEAVEKYISFIENPGFNVISNKDKCHMLYLLNEEVNNLKQNIQESIKKMKDDNEES